MERKTLSKSLKYHSIGAKDSLNTNQNHNLPSPNMFKSSCIAAATAYQSYRDQHRHHHYPAQSYHHDYIASGGLSWPPRSYPCTFCKREFRSAQALGGHMNVHRRDRARLRQSSPPPPASTGSVSSDGQYSFPSFNPGNPNPNPNLSSSSSAPFLPTRSHPPLYSTLTASAPQIHLDAPLPFPRLSPIEGDFLDRPDSVSKHPARTEDRCQWTKGLTNNNLGLIKPGMEVEVVKEDLDLELRLGWPY